MKKKANYLKRTKKNLKRRIKNDIDDITEIKIEDMSKYRV